jgi:hypothetical protein
MTTHRCSVPICSSVKAENNNWWVVGRFWFGKSIIQIIPWSEELVSRVGLKTACGMECLLKLVSELVHEVSDEHKKEA